MLRHEDHADIFGSYDFVLDHVAEIIKRSIIYKAVHVCVDNMTFIEGALFSTPFPAVNETIQESLEFSKFLKISLCQSCITRYTCGLLLYKL